MARIAEDPCLDHLSKLPACEKEALIYCVLRHFVRWRTGDVLQLEGCVSLIKDICFIRSVPRFEAASLLYAIRDIASSLSRTERLRAGQFEDKDSKEESTFFDLVAFELISGY